MKGIYSSAAFLSESGVSRVAGGAMVEVRRESDGGLATLYYDKDGLYQSGNPIEADGDGNFFFYADGLEEGYIVSVSKNGVTITVRNQPIGNARYWDVEQLRDAMAMGEDDSPTFAMVTITGTPSASGDVISLGFLQTHIRGYDAKPNVRVKTTTNDSLSGLSARDGVVLKNGDRVLAGDQIYDYENGIWIANSGAWTRALDFDSYDEVPGAYVFVEEGSTNAETGWLCTNNAESPAPALGSVPISWIQFAGPGTFQASDAELTAIAGLISAADKAPYFTGSGSAALFDLTSDARLLLAEDVAGMRSVLDVYSTSEADAAFQPLDADLTALSLLSASSPEVVGLVTRKTGGGFELRSVVAGSNKVTIARGDGGGGNIEVDVDPANLAGRQTLWIPAGALRYRQANSPTTTPSVTAGATNQPDVEYLALDGGSPQVKTYFQFTARMPKSWNEGTVTASFTWRRASGTGAANVVFGLRAAAVGDNESPAQNFGAEQTVTDAASTVAAANVMISGETGAVQIGAGSPPLSEALVFFEGFRDRTNASDTLTVDVELLGVTLYFNTNALNDA